MERGWGGGLQAVPVSRSSPWPHRELFLHTQVAGSPGEHPKERPLSLA